MTMTMTMTMTTTTATATTTTATTIRMVRIPLSLMLVLMGERTCTTVSLVGRAATHNCKLCLITHSLTHSFIHSLQLRKTISCLLPLLALATLSPAGNFPTRRVSVVCVIG